MIRTTGSAPFHPGTPWDLFRFEAPGAGAPAIAEPAAAPAAGDPGVDPGMGGGDPSPWSGVTQDQWEEQQHRLHALTSWAQQVAAAQAQGGQGEPVRFDPFSDDADQQIRQIIEEAIGPLQQSHEEMSLAAAQELAFDVIDDYVAREGEFLHEGSRELAFRLAKGFLPQAMQRYGHSDRAGEVALEQACKHVRELEESIGKSYHERQTNQLATLAGARTEPGAPGQAAQIVAGPYGRGQRVTDRFFGGR